MACERRQQTSDSITSLSTSTGRKEGGGGKNAFRLAGENGSPIEAMTAMSNGGDRLRWPFFAGGAYAYG